ncbi:MAG: hypothetical protein KDA99_18815 [Planctomycetales bacterium]|nr:hypothetical protein [Planctomycetales bacterium]
MPICNVASRVLVQYCFLRAIGTRDRSGDGDELNRVQRVRCPRHDSSIFDLLKVFRERYDSISNHRVWLLAAARASGCSAARKIDVLSPRTAASLG